MANGPAPVALEFANTHVVTLRRHDPAFRKLTECFDAFLPDGTPLIWCLNVRGAGLRDRVYGPAFMRHCLIASGAPASHYLLGGSAATGDRVRQIAGELNPQARIVGAFHGACGADGRLEGEAEEAVLREINELAPDFVWVGLGTPKQQAWIQRNKARVRRGVIGSVGFAFDVLAGTKPDAPSWMQRTGLTWLFRLASEPRRLAGRYLKYNTLFLWYLLWDGVRGRALQRGEPPGPEPAQAAPN
jgi:N-acetylglucosaminyldiphosphoundecaprenol N-acetyl-beta-D-mannosaminyltransferase